jgi:sugar transferase (PEP-CTERM/EpsH1 system associated)
MLHVVHVLHSLEVGGTENGLVSVVGALRAEYHHSVIAVTHGGPLQARLPGDVAVHELGKRPGIDVRAAVRLSRLLRRLSPDIVHSRNWGAFDAVLAARLARVPVVIHGEHGREATDPDGLNPRRNRVRRWVAPFVDRWVTVSAELERWLVRVVGIPSRKVRTICNGVDLSRFSPGDRRAARAAMRLPEHVTVIGTVGRLDPVKDQIGLMEAYARLPQLSPPHALVIVGGGPCRETLIERASRPDLAGRVHLLGERGDVPQLLAGFDVFVLPSLAEGISNTILEAMASALPVIATRVGGNPELVDDGATGTLVPVGDREALSAALGMYLDGPALRARQGRAGRQRVVESFGLDRMAEGYRHLYATAARRVTV